MKLVWQVGLKVYLVLLTIVNKNYHTVTYYLAYTVIEIMILNSLSTLYLGLLFEQQTLNALRQNADKKSRENHKWESTKIGIKMPQAKWTGFIIINELVKKLSIYYTLLLLDPREGLENVIHIFPLWLEITTIQS